MLQKKIICSAVVGVLMFAASASGQQLEKKIIGKWTGNVELTKKYWKDQEQEVREFLLKQVPNTSISFLRDGGLEVEVKSPDGESRQIGGTYKVVESNEKEKTLTLKFIPKSDDGPPEVEVNVKVLTNGMKTSLAIEPSNDPAIVFSKNEKKQKSEK